MIATMPTKLPANKPIFWHTLMKTPLTMLPSLSMLTLPFPTLPVTPTLKPRSLTR